MSSFFFSFLFFCNFFFLRFGLSLPFDRPSCSSFICAHFCIFNPLNVYDFQTFIESNAADDSIFSAKKLTEASAALFLFVGPLLLSDSLLFVFDIISLILPLLTSSRNLLLAYLQCRNFLLVTVLTFGEQAFAVRNPHPSLFGIPLF